ncbi:reverse transcriptase domain-containing protein [Tanacetum coccineum]
MADNRTMAQMLQAPIEGYEDAIVVPPINANNFELKQTLINLVQSNQFTGKQDPHNHLRFFNKVTSTFRHPEVPNTTIKLLLFPFSLEGEARTWLDKEPPRSILTWDDLVSKFINQFFPPSKTTYLRNEITTFYQKPNETFNEAWERFKGLLRQCPHHGFSELHQLDTFYNSLNTNDQDALDSAAGGNFLDKMPRDGLAIIESKSKVRYSRSRAIEPRVSTNAPLSTSTPSNSFEFQQLAASLEDKMDIRMSRLEKMISEKNVTTPATVKAVEEVCVTCGSNHNFNNCPLTRNEFPVFHDNIHQFQQTAAVGNFVQRNPPNLANQYGCEARKKEQAYNEEQYTAARGRMLSIPFVDEDDYIPLGDIIARYSTSTTITHDLPIEEPDNSLSMGDEHLDTTSIENLVPIPSELEGISDDTSDVPNCDNNRINVESDLVESLSNHDTSIVYSSKIDPILEEFVGKLAHIAPIPPGIVEADFDPNDDTSSDDDSFENIEYVDASPSYSELDSLEEENEDQEEKEFNLEDIFQIQDVILREKLLNVHRLISNIESLKDKPTPDRVLESLSPFPIPVVDSDSFLEESDTSLSHLDNSLPEFETFSDHTEETRSGSTTTHANYSLPEYDSFLFEIEPDQEGLISNDNSNDLFFGTSRV